MQKNVPAQLLCNSDSGMKGCVPGTNEQKSPGSWVSQWAEASICLSWGNSVCCDWELCLFVFTPGMCACVWCVSWYQHYQVCFTVAAAPWPCPAKYLGGCCGLVRCVFYVLSVCVWVAHDISQTETIPSLIWPITASSWLHTLPKARPTHLYSQHSRPRLVSPLNSVLSHPFFFLFFTLSMLLFLAENQSMQNLCVTAHMWLCNSCMCLCTQRELNMMFK